MKDKIIKDLHTVLYTLNLESLPDNDTVRIAMCKAIIDENHLFFLERKQIAGSNEWTIPDPCDHFFDKVVPGIIPSENAFGNVCDLYFDWDLYEKAKPAQDAFTAILDSMKNIVAPFTVKELHEPTTIDLIPKEAA